MKSFTLILALLFSTLSLFSQHSNTGTSPMYMKKMGGLLTEFSKAESVEDLTKLSNQFNIIAQAETDKWLPLYYATQIKIIISFREQDPVKKDEILDEIEANFDVMSLINETQSEIPALKSLFYSARLVVDPMTRGQEYMMKSNKECEKALKLNPKNNRANYMLIKNFMGFASFFGSDTSEQCQTATTLLENWEDNENMEMFMPKWGKSGIEGIIKSCSLDNGKK